MPTIITEYINEVDSFIGYFKRTCLTNSGIVNSITEAIEKNAGVDRIYAVYAFVSFLAITACCLVGFGAKLICNLIGFAYPFYLSHKTIDLKRSNNYKGLVYYWMGFSFFIVLDSISDILMFIFPFYWLVKLMILHFAFNDNVDSKLGKELVENFLNTTGLKEELLYLGLALVLPRVLVFGNYAVIFCNLLGLIYPLIVTNKEIPLFQHKYQRESILNYWIIFSCFCIGDFVFSFVNSWYWLVKFLFLALVFAYNFQKYERQPDDNQQEAVVICIICCDNRVNCTLDPCGHAQFCDKCTVDLKPGDLCYTCKTPINQKLAIFLP